LQFEIAVIQCDAISLAPTVLMPVVVGTAYTQNLVAHGGRSDFTWSVDASSLPPGLSWDADSHQLSGTVTDATQVGKAFSLVVGLSASDVIMDPLTVSLGITVQSAPVVASDMPSWEKIFIYSMTASGVVILALAVFAINRYRAAKANAKTAEAVKAGNTNVENATKGDPKSITKAIAQDDKAKLATVAGNIPDVQNLLNGIKQRLNDVVAEVAKNETKISELKKYLDDHKRDNLNDSVTDEALAQDYPEYKDVINGLDELRKLNKAKMQELSTAAEWSNKVTNKTVSDQNKIADAGNSKSNDDSLLND
jgi:hypothetical protein